MDAAVVTEVRGRRIVRVLRAVFAVYGLIALLWIPLRNVGSGDFSTADYLSYPPSRATSSPSSSS